MRHQGTARCFGRTRLHETSGLRDPEVRKFRELGSMNRALRRGDFIRGRFAPHPDVFRPPYAIAEMDFRAACDRCGQCANVCPTGVIGRDKDQLPMLRFGDAACTFCGKCAEACKTGALNSAAAEGWNVLPDIRNTCLSLNAITCRTCEEACEADAIRFRLMTAGRAEPQVNSAKCTGCGQCAFVCPNQSIRMTRAPSKEADA